MRLILAAVASLALIVAAPAQEAQPETTCGPMITMLSKVHQAVAIKKITVLKGEQADKLRDWFNALPPEDNTPYDLVLVLEHENGHYGVAVGWRKDPKLEGHASLCAAAPVKDDQLLKFNEITGLGGTGI